MLEAKLVLFQLPQEGMPGYVGNWLQATFEEASARLTPVDAPPRHELVVVVLDAIVTVEARIYQPIVTPPPLVCTLAAKSILPQTIPSQVFSSSLVRLPCRPDHRH
jgi:hypothetical protein